MSGKHACITLFACVALSVAGNMGAQAQSRNGGFNVNPDAFIQSLPQDEQRRLSNPKNGSLFDNMRNGNGGAGDLKFGGERFGEETPEQFFNAYLKCDEVRAGYRRTDGCTPTYTKYCKLFRALPDDIRKNIGQKVECQANGDTGDYDGAGAMPGGSGCGAADTRTLALMRKYYGKEEEMRSLVFFVDRLSRDLNKCTRGG